MDKLDIQLFKIMYLLVHCDMDFSEEESELIEQFKNNLTDEELAQANESTQALQPIIDSGFSAIKIETVKIAEELAPFIQDSNIKESSLRIMESVVMADNLEHPNEKELMDDLKQAWA